MRRIIYDGDSFYELDEECIRRREEQEKRRKTDLQRNKKNDSDGEGGKRKFI